MHRHTARGMPRVVAGLSLQERLQLGIMLSSIAYTYQDDLTLLCSTFCPISKVEVPKLLLNHR